MARPRTVPRGRTQGRRNPGTEVTLEQDEESRGLYGPLGTDSNRSAQGLQAAEPWDLAQHLQIRWSPGHRAGGDPASPAGSRGILCPQGSSTASGPL